MNRYPTWRTGSLGRGEACFAPLRLILTFVLCLSLFNPVLAPAQAGSDGAVLFVDNFTGSQAVKKGSSVDIKVTISEVPDPGIASLQGELAYDQSLIKITDIKLPSFPENGSIIATNVSLPGKARFAATILAKDAKPVKDGNLLIFHAECLKNGRSDLTLSIEALADVDDDKVKFDVTQGAIECRGGGQAPRANFSFAPVTPLPGEAVQFTDQSTDPDGGNVAQWVWDFGDGSKSSEKNPKHTYTARGCYLVSLKITDDDDPLSDQTTKRLSVGNGCPDVILINYPNPAKTETTFDYEFLKTVKQATLMVFNIKGQKVLENSKLIGVGTKGQYKWSLRDLGGKDSPNGPYFYWIVAVTQENRVVKSPTNVLVIQR
ncbi:PKD domain-containing protein [Candidatus Acetothermia bacterium]|nr:PKD domain-containing protein [Candidatus Acetothermia bacterium]